MGEKEAKSAEGAIDRDKWGKGEKGELAAKCPKGCKKEYRIPPAMGIARVGNSPDQYFLGAEKESDDIPSEFYTLNTASPTTLPAATTISTTADKTIYKDKASTKT